MDIEVITLIELTPLLRRFGFNEVLLSRLESRKHENDYWSRAVDFVEQISTRSGGLSTRQHNWLVGILDDLKEPWG